MHGVLHGMVLARAKMTLLAMVFLGLFGMGLGAVFSAHPGGQPHEPTEAPRPAPGTTKAAADARPLREGVRAEPVPSRDLQRLQGTWLLRSEEREGKPHIAPENREQRLVIEGDQFRFQGDDHLSDCTLTLDETASPRALDAQPNAANAGKNPPCRGIYEFRGDDLVVCLGGRGDARPKAFRTEPNKAGRLLVFQRIPRQPPAPKAPRAAEIDRLIEQLGAPLFKEREEAAKGLRALGKEALPRLEKAARDHLEIEVRHRAKRLVEELRGRSANGVQRFSGHTGAVCAVVISRDGKFALSGSTAADPTVRL
jgi:uncharacterized protein (TIGR03067 family)